MLAPTEQKVYHVGRRAFCKTCNADLSGSERCGHAPLLLLKPLMPGYDVIDERYANGYYAEICHGCGNDIDEDMCPTCFGAYRAECISIGVCPEMECRGRLTADGFCDTCGFILGDTETT